MAAPKFDCGDEDAVSLCSTEIPQTPFSRATEQTPTSAAELAASIFFLNEYDHADGRAALSCAKANVYWDRRGPVDLHDNKKKLDKGTVAKLGLPFLCTVVAFWVAAFLCTWHSILIVGIMSSSRGIRVSSTCFSLWGVLAGAFWAVPLFPSQPSA
eukprot:TRINITY_DN3983_c0_g1_i1.p1 TRINITY_DN3983_c0_g1~~TRINITY_DN3983_c0_g1_i1.p1  ORF type:complete len:178 (+),score=19.58 TRINITY_DN3983_c0_g1_i1:67-534(+)